MQDLQTMQIYFDKMKEYLNMDIEIPFEEFRDYYSDLIEYLKERFDALSVDEGLQALFVLYNLDSNCEYRAKQKSPNQKKYKKMHAMTNVWCAAMRKKL